jgi:sugar/nucleoside kinase (ribokinase family)
LIRIQGNILCAGNLVFDILVRPVDTPRYGATTWVDAIERHLGGNAANTAYTLALMGVPVTALGSVGRDAFGEQVLAWLASAGVDLSGIERSEAATAASVVLVASDGERCLLHYPGASAEAFPAPIDFTGRFAGAGHFHLANPFALAGLRQVAAESLGRAKAAGLSTSLDAGWDAKGEWMAVLGPCLAYTDLLMLNLDEARMLSGFDDPGQAAAFLRDRGSGSIVVKLGEQGCRVFADCGEFRSPGFAIEAVDTTGAGDCFAGGFLAALHHGADYVEAARFANAAGARSAGSLGSVEGLLSYSDTLSWLTTRPRRTGLVRDLETEV